MKTTLQLFNLIIREPIFILFSAFLGFLTIGSSIGLMSVSALLISNAALRFPLGDLMVLIVGVRFFGISRAVFRYLERYFTHSTTLKILSKIRVWFYEKVEPLVPGVLDSVHNGDLFSRMVNDIDSLKEFYLRVINPPIVAIFVLAIMCFFLNIINSLLMITIILFFIFGGLIIPYFLGVLNKKSVKKLSLIKSNINISMVESFLGVSEILTNNLQQLFYEKLNNLNSQLMRVQILDSLFKGISSAVISISGNLCMWAALLICIPMVTNGTLNGNMLAVIALGIVASFEALVPMSQLFSKYNESHFSAHRVFEISSLKTSLTVDFAKNNRPNNYNIGIENLSVSYSKDTTRILTNISFDLPEGKKLAIVGPNGSGKSTLIQVILGFLPYESGKIKLGNVDLNIIDSEIILDNFAIVPQNTYLFNSTILENLKIANLEASEEQIIECLKSAGIFDFISSLPLGLNTHIGEGGFKLSGGQRQRLAIARALLKDRPILILDEPSSGLDPISEKKLLISLKEVWEKKSVLLITHKFFGLEEMDEILVLKNGSIIERGTHISLLQQKGVYFNMWKENQ